MTDEPNWKLIPGNLLEFFKLQRGCDQRALKRAYGKLLRQFKPERFPEEFKKIREAYEQLQQQIEYGYWDLEEDSQSPHAEKDQASQLGYEIEPEDVVEYDQANPPQVINSGSSSETLSEPELNPDEIPEYEQTKAPEIKVSVEPTWNERLETDNPEDLYTELVSKTPKEPEDYLKLAILSDVVSEEADSSQTSLFETWLLRGLKQFPQNYILLSAFRDYLTVLPESRFSSEKQQVQFLVHIAEIINTHQFFGTTYSLWMALIRTASPEIIQQTLEQCESLLFDPNENEKLVFYIRILSALEWRIREARRARSLKGEAVNLKKVVSWLLSKRDYLEDHYDLIPYHDLDLIFHDVGLVSSYFSSLDLFLDSDNVHFNWRKRLHQMLREFIMYPTEIAQEKLHQFQLSVLKNEASVLNCFAASNEGDKKFLNLWRWMASTSPGIHLESETDLERMRKNTKQFLRHADRVQLPDDSSLGKKQARNKWIMIIVPISAIIPIIIGMTLLSISDLPFMTLNGTGFPSLGGLIASFLIVIFSALFGIRIQKLLLSKNVNTELDLNSKQVYQQHLQPLWVSFLANNHWQHESLNEILKAELVHWESINTDLLFQYCLKDTGALIVALARRVLP